MRHRVTRPELSGCTTTLTVRNMEVANFCAAMDTLIDQDASYEGEQGKFRGEVHIQTVLASDLSWHAAISNNVDVIAL